MEIKRSWLVAQTLVLLGGTVFAWTNALAQIREFYELYGTLFRFTDCVIPNPFTTACLYGSIAFLVAFIWSVRVLQTQTGERYLRNFLIFCVLFAGSVVSLEFAQFYGVVPTSVPSVGCTPGIAPTLTPCFYGFLIFFLAFLISWANITRRPH